MAYPQKLLNPEKKPVWTFIHTGGFRQRSPVSHHFSRPCHRCCVDGRRWIDCWCAHLDHHRLGDHCKSSFRTSLGVVGDYLLRGDNRSRHLSNGSDFLARHRDSLGRVNNVLFNQSLLERLIGAEIYLSSRAVRADSKHSPMCEILIAAEFHSRRNRRASQLIVPTSAQHRQNDTLSRWRSVAS